MNARAYIIGVLAIVATIKIAAAEPPAQSFDWKNVRIGGGGFVTGLIVDPVSPDRIYARTDVGGLYARDRGPGEWVPLTDSFSREQRGDLSVDSAVMDPSDPKTLYLAVGMYTTDWWPMPGGIRKSTDAGRTWSQPVRLARGDGTLVKFGGNETKRWAGERLAVDPFDRNHILVGTRHDGLFRSTDAGASFVPVNADFQVGTPGITSILFDRHRRGHVALAAYGDAVHLSTDSGNTWTRTQAGPALVNRLAGAADGTLWAVCTSRPEGQGVFRYAAGEWTNVTPASEWPSHYTGVAVNPAKNDHVIVATGEADFLKLFSTRDAGTTWSEVARTTRSTVPWITPFMNRIPWTADLKFDPSDPKRVYVTDWYGVWLTEDINAPRVELTNVIAGLESLVIFDLTALPNGTLLTACADLGGFIHKGDDISDWPARLSDTTDQYWQDTYSIDYCRTKPDRVVRVGARREGGAGFWLSVSDDGGSTWRTPKATGRPEGRLSRVAVSSADPDLFVVICDNKPAIVTHDGGETFATIPAQQLPVAPFGPWYTGDPLVADPVDGNRFYFMHPDGRFYTSRDGGKTWSKSESAVTPGKVGPDIKFKPHVVRASSAHSGRVYVANDSQGLFRSDDSGRTFSRIESVKRLGALAIGPTTEGGDAVYLWGTVGSQEGVFRSTDDGQSWTRLTTDDNKLALTHVLIADPVRPNRIYVGTSGRGVFVGTQRTPER